jgi:hypothetical protein
MTNITNNMTVDYYDQEDTIAKVSYVLLEQTESGRWLELCTLMDIDGQDVKDYYPTPEAS